MTRAVLVALAVALAAAPAATARPGDLDRRFGNKGTAYTEQLDGAFRATVMPDGRILVAGGIYQPGVMRLMPHGRRDRRFGRRGIAASGRRNAEPFGIRRRVSDGEITVGAGTVTTHAPPVELLRFRGGGTTLAPAVHEAPFAGPIIGGALRRDGGAYVHSLRELRAVAPDGTVDTTFGDGTLGRDELGGAGLLEVIALRPDGRVLLATTKDRRPALLQLLPDGRLDPAFGDGGVASIPFAPAVLAPLRDGTVLGAARGSRSTLLRIFRIRAGGAATRARTLPWRARSNGYLADVAEDRRGRLYALTNLFRRRRPAVLAFTRSGRPVRRFGRRGVARLPRPPRGFIHANEGSDLVLHRGGLLVVGTHYRDGLGHPVHGCGCREDISAGIVRAAVWRLRR